MAEESSTPRPTAAALGYRMPAEFEPVEAVWLAYPRDPESWPGCFERARLQFDGFIKAARRFTRVEVIGRGRDIPTDDSWIRDYGPLFVSDDRGGLACHDFTFNNWGGKYPGHERDDAVPQHIARLLGIPRWRHDMVLEGGGLDSNGRGTVMTTESCLLNRNRNPRLEREQIELKLHDTLGARHVIWLPGGLIGDDTDGHVDTVARFVGPRTVLASRGGAIPDDRRRLELNYERLRIAHDQDGRPIEVVELPMPAQVSYEYPSGAFQEGLQPLPASYANFLIVNDGVLVPTFGQRADDQALRVIAKALPRRTVVPVPSGWLLVGLGALHCLSITQPRV